MGRQITTTTPSGLIATVRGLKGAEINLFANKTEAEQRNVGMELLDSITLSVEDAGPLYELDDKGRPDWEKLIDADRFWLYMFGRIATYGADYVFRYQCGKATCRHRFGWGVQLDRDLKQKQLPARSIEQFLEGNCFGPIHFGDDEIHFQLLTGEIEKAGLAMKNRRPDEATTLTVANRIKALNADESKVNIHNWVKALDLLDLLDLIDELDRVDGGIDTDIEIQCPKCGHIQEVRLPLGVDFWTPDKRLRSLVKKGVKIPEGGGHIRLSSDS